MKALELANGVAMLWTIKRRSGGFAELVRRQYKMTIKIGLKFKHNKRNWTLTGWSEGLPIVTCKETGQTQKVRDEDLDRLLKGVG